MVVKVYLDSCIFLAYYYEKGSSNYSQVEKCLKLHEKNQKIFSFVTSDFTFTEFVKVATSPKNIPHGTIFEDLSTITRTTKIGGLYPFDIIEVEGKRKGYHFNDFFVDLQSVLMNVRPGLADTMHYQIMTNNNVTRILTFNTRDFEKIDGIEAIHPGQIEEHFKKIKS
jgi:predicted nucleic acid-binding protein